MKLKFFTISLLLTFTTFAQEYTVIGGYNQKNKLETKKSAETIELPFFDDFSQISKFSSNFIDNDVTIETKAAILPPSIGVAMFDAIDSDGDFHSSSYNTKLRGDELTSAPINLDYPDDNTIYMSFYYQPKGLLDLPDENDSLVLQFLAPRQNKWNNVWSASNAKSNQDFKQIIINISDTSYLHDDFQFRFYNKISMPSNSYPSLVGNCDHWFVDYIYINRNRTDADTIRRDIAFIYPIDYKIDDYHTIPYSHYLENVNNNVFEHNYLINFRNNDVNNRDIDSMYIVFEQKEDLLENDTLYLGSSSFPGFNNFDLESDNFNFPYPETTYDEMNFSLKTKLVTDSYDSLCNNEIIQHKEMSVVYAYDDGTSENGYGLLGTGTLYAHVVQKYYTYSTDYLTGIQVYINKTFKEHQPYYFYAEVWEEDVETNLPGEKVYEQEGFEINHDKLGKFQTFTFDEPIEVSDTFYIGWMKTYDEIMNIGIDKNSTNTNYKLYNIYGDWQYSSIGGVMMIRPIFGNTSLADAKENNSDFVKMFPNPVDNLLNIEISQSLAVESYVKIFDFSGRIIYNNNFYSNSFSIDMSDYTSGIYFVELFVTGEKIHKKILKQ